MLAMGGGYGKLCTWLNSASPVKCPVLLGRFLHGIIAQVQKTKTGRQLMLVMVAMLGAVGT